MHYQILRPVEIDTLWNVKIIDKIFEDSIGW